MIMKKIKEKFKKREPEIALAKTINGKVLVRIREPEPITGIRLTFLNILIKLQEIQPKKGKIKRKLNRMIATVKLNRFVRKSKRILEKRKYYERNGGNT